MSDKAAGLGLSKSGKVDDYSQYCPRTRHPGLQSTNGSSEAKANTPTATVTQNRGTAPEPQTSDQPRPVADGQLQPTPLVSAGSVLGDAYPQDVESQHPSLASSGSGPDGRSSPQTPPPALAPANSGGESVRKAEDETMQSPGMQIMETQASEIPPRPCSPSHDRRSEESDRQPEQKSPRGQGAEETTGNTQGPEPDRPRRYRMRSLGQRSRVPRAPVRQAYFSYEKASGPNEDSQAEPNARNRFTKHPAPPKETQSAPTIAAPSLPKPKPQPPREPTQTAQRDRSKADGRATADAPQDHPPSEQPKDPSEKDPGLSDRSRGDEKQRRRHRHKHRHASRSAPQREATRDGSNGVGEVSEGEVWPRYDADPAQQLYDEGRGLGIFEGSLAERWDLQDVYASFSPGQLPASVAMVQLARDWRDVAAPSLLGSYVEAEAAPRQEPRGGLYAEYMDDQLPAHVFPGLKGDTRDFDDGECLPDGAAPQQVQPSRHYPNGYVNHQFARDAYTGTSGRFNNTQNVFSGGAMFHAGAWHPQYNQAGYYNETMYREDFDPLRGRLAEGADCYRDQAQEAHMREMAAARRYLGGQGY